jgi:hypothetical protein
MNKIGKIGILLFCFFTAINLLNAQSEKETIDFLNAKLFAFEQNPSHKINTTIHPSLNKKVIQINGYWNGLFVIYYILPEHKSTVESFRAPNGRLCLKVISNKGALLKRHKREDGVSIMLGGEIRFVLDTTEEEILRVKKGLIHLFKLNSGAIIEDNLFKD